MPGASGVIYHQSEGRQFSVEDWPCHRQKRGSRGDESCRNFVAFPATIVVLYSMLVGYSRVTGSNLVMLVC
jgi:hypothetical protein